MAYQPGPAQTVLAASVARRYYLDVHQSATSGDIQEPGDLEAAQSEFLGDLNLGSFVR